MVSPHVPSGEIERPDAVAVAVAEVAVALAVERVPVGPVKAVSVSISRMMLVLEAMAGRVESGLTAQTSSYSCIHSSFL